MTALDPKAMADALRDEWKKNPPPAPDPDERHEQSFLAHVCNFLGVEPSVIHMTHVAKLMGNAKLEPHKADEYPKMLSTKDKQGRLVAATYPDGHDLAGQPIVFNSREEEDEYGKGPEKAEA